MIDRLRRMRESRLLLPTLLLLLGGISYGSLFTANKIAIDAGFPFIAYAFWQALFASAVLLTLSAIFSKPPSLRRENLRVFGLVAVFGFLGPLLVVTFVADRLPPAVLTLCAALIPATTYTLTLVLRLDRLRWLSVAGVLLGFGGIVLIVVPTGSLPEAGAWIWVLFSLLMPLSAAVNNVAGARFSPVGVSALALAGGMMMVSALLLLIAMLAEGELFLPTDADPSGLWGLLWATAGQAITYSCFFEIVRRAGALFSRAAQLRGGGRRHLLGQHLLRHGAQPLGLGGGGGAGSEPGADQRRHRARPARAGRPLRGEAVRPITSTRSCRVTQIGLSTASIRATTARRWRSVS